MVDAVRFDEDPDPTFYTNADPDPNFNSFRNIKISNKTYNLIKFNLTTFLYLNFSKLSGSASVVKNFGSRSGKLMRLH